MEKRTFMRFSVLLMLVNLLLTVSLHTHARKVGRWEKLGERTVNLTLDKDVVRCGHQGAFTAIRFHVDKAPVSFLRVMVRYANGSTDDLNFSQFVRPSCVYRAFLPLRTLPYCRFL